MDVLSALKTNLLSLVMGVLVVFLLWNRRSKSRYAWLPPGPRPLPLVGNLFEFRLKESYKYYMEVSNQCFEYVVQAVALAQLAKIIKFNFKVNAN